MHRLLRTGKNMGNSETPVVLRCQIAGQFLKPKLWNGTVCAIARDLYMIEPSVSICRLDSPVVYPPQVSTSLYLTPLGCSSSEKTARIEL